MDKYFITYNNETNLDVNLLVMARPSKPSPNMDYEIIKVPGGKTLYREKGYGDIEIPVSFNFMSKDSKNWDKDFRNMKKWLLSKGNRKLKFSDDLEFFYRVNRVTVDAPERIGKRIGKFTVIFTCEPYVYIETNEIKLKDFIYNKYLTSRPIYRIVGEGYLKLNINGKEIKVNVGQELVIDTDKGLCYREGIINNVALEGKYEDMYLQEGENAFSWNGDFDIFIAPNWRCL